MNTIAGPRGSGKTTELIRLCAEENAKGTVTYIVVAGRGRATYVADMARDMGAEIPFPLTFDEITRPAVGSFMKQVLVDNADDFVRTIARNGIGVHVAGMTFTLDGSDGDTTLLRYEIEPAYEYPPGTTLQADTGAVE